MFRNLVLKLGLILPNQSDVESVIIRKKLSNEILLMLKTFWSTSLYSDTYIEMDELNHYRIGVDYHSKLRLMFLQEPKDIFSIDRGYLKNISCEFIANHINEINAALDELSILIPAKYNENMLDKQSRIDKERKFKQQQLSCLNKLWNHYKEN